MFITVVTRPRQWSLFWLTLTQPTLSNSCFPKICFNIILTSVPILYSDLFSSGFETKYLYPFIISHMRATCSAHLTLLDFVIVIIFGTEYKFSVLLSLNLLCRVYSYLIKYFGPRYARTDMTKLIVPVRYRRFSNVFPRDRGVRIIRMHITHWKQPKHVIVMCSTFFVTCPL